MNLFQRTIIRHGRVFPFFTAVLLISGFCATTYLTVSVLLQSAKSRESSRVLVASDSLDALISGVLERASGLVDIATKEESTVRILEHSMRTHDFVDTARAMQKYVDYGRISFLEFISSDGIVETSFGTSSQRVGKNVRNWKLFSGTTLTQRSATLVDVDDHLCACATAAVWSEGKTIGVMVFGVFITDGLLQNWSKNLGVDLGINITGKFAVGNRFLAGLAEQPEFNDREVRDRNGVSYATSSFPLESALGRRFGSAVVGRRLSGFMETWSSTIWRSLAFSLPISILVTLIVSLFVKASNTLTTKLQERISDSEKLRAFAADVALATCKIEVDACARRFKKVSGVDVLALAALVDQPHEANARGEQTKNVASLPMLDPFKTTALDIYVLAVERATLQARQERFKFEAAVARTTQSLAHDVRKPFSLLKVTLQTLTTCETPEEIHDTARSYLPAVNQALASVNGMIADIMQISSDTPPSKEAIAPERIVEMTLQEVAGIYPHADVEISFDWGHGHLAPLDVLKVTRAFSNVVCNALQASHFKGRIWVETKETYEDGQRSVAFRIGNDKSFIPEENRSKLFDPYFTSGKKGGTGLGLAIAQKIVELHGGRIWCTSSRTDLQPSGQVEFHLVFPSSEVTSPPTRTKFSTTLQRLRRGFEAVAEGVGAQVERGVSASISTEDRAKGRNPLGASIDRAGAVKATKATKVQKAPSGTLAPPTASPEPSARHPLPNNKPSSPPETRTHAPAWRSTCDMA